MSPRRVEHLLLRRIAVESDAAGGREHLLLITQDRRGVGKGASSSMQDRYRGRCSPGVGSISFHRYSLRNQMLPRGRGISLLPAPFWIIPNSYSAEPWKALEMGMEGNEGGGGASPSKYNRCRFRCPPPPSSPSTPSSKDFQGPMLEEARRERV